MSKLASLNQRFRRVTLLILGANSLIFAGHLLSFKMISDGGARHNAAFNMASTLNEIDLNLHEISLSLSNLNFSPELDVKIEEIKKIEDDTTSAFERATRASYDQSVTHLLETATKLFVTKIKPKTFKFLRLTDLQRHDAEENFFREYSILTSELEDLLVKSRTKASSDAQLFGTQQSNFIMLAAVLLAALIVGSTFTLVLLVKAFSSGAWSILEALFEQLSNSTETVAKAAHSIDSISKEVTESSVQNASAIEGTAIRMEEMEGMIGRATNNATDSLRLSREAQVQVETSKDVIAQMNSAMFQIQSANSKLNNILNIIRDIKNKTNIINDIVFETRLLSFNASIEAARAGTHGKGFAVVAEEVGKLANVSGKAADEIHTLLESSTAEVNQIISSIQDRVTSAKSVSERCESSFHLLAVAMNQIANAMDGITTSTSQQEKGIRQTNRVISEIAVVTQRNSNSAEDLSSQVSALSSQIGSLSRLIFKLRNFLYGSNSRSTMPMTKAINQWRRAKIVTPESSDRLSDVHQGEEKKEGNDSDWKRSA